VDFPGKNGMTMRVMQRMATRNMDITQEIWIQDYLEAQKMDCNGRKFKGLTPLQQHMWIYTRILINESL
jgi:hypothetical protein